MRTVSSREVYRNAWMRVREDAVALADGTPGVYGVVDKADFALVVPMADDGVWMVEQFRYPVGERSWEFPQGTWPAGAGGRRRSSPAPSCPRRPGCRPSTSSTSAGCTRRTGSAASGSTSGWPGA